MSAKELRGYQSRLLTELRDSYRRGNRRILIQLPTGGGKSVVFSKIMGSSHAKENTNLFLVHRRELVDQASQHMTNEGVEHGIIMSGVFPDLVQKTQLASVQTLWARCVKADRFNLPGSKVVVVDEAHHVGSKMYDHLFNHYSDSLIIGVTATPTRKNGRGLGHYFDDLIIGATVRELMDAGFLAEAVYMVPAVPDLEGIHTRGGDFVEEELADVMNDAKLVGNLVEHYQAHAENRKMVAFAVNVAHSRAIVNMFNHAGIPAAHVDGKTKLPEREQIIADFSVGKYKILSNCEVFTEGVDMPDVDGVILARPTKSLRMYLQMAGRGLRPKSDGGDCLILDHAGNVLRHGPVDEEHDWSLNENENVSERDEQKKADEDKPESEPRDFICSSCGYVFHSQDICPKCGTPLTKFSEDVETARGQLVGLPKTKKPKKKEMTMAEKQQWYGMFLMHAANKGYNPGWAYHKYREKFGVAPANGMSKGLVQPTPEFMNYIRHLNIKFARSKQR